MLTRLACSARSESLLAAPLPILVGHIGGKDHCGGRAPPQGPDSGMGPDARRWQIPEHRRTDAVSPIHIVESSTGLVEGAAPAIALRPLFQFQGERRRDGVGS